MASLCGLCRHKARCREKFTRDSSSKDVSIRVFGGAAKTNLVGARNRFGTQDTYWMVPTKLKELKLHGEH